MLHSTVRNMSRAVCLTRRPRSPLASRSLRTIASSSPPTVMLGREWARVQSVYGVLWRSRRRATASRWTPGRTLPAGITRRHFQCITRPPSPRPCLYCAPEPLRQGEARLYRARRCGGARVEIAAGVYRVTATMAPRSARCKCAQAWGNLDDSDASRAHPAAGRVSASAPGRIHRARTWPRRLGRAAPATAQSRPCSRVRTRPLRHDRGMP